MPLTSIDDTSSLINGWIEQLLKPIKLQVVQGRCLSSEIKDALSSELIQCLFFGCGADYIFWFGPTPHAVKFKEKLHECLVQENMDNYPMEYKMIKSFNATYMTPRSALWGVILQCYWVNKQQNKISKNQQDNIRKLIFLYEIVLEKIKADGIPLSEALCQRLQAISAEDVNTIARELNLVGQAHLISSATKLADFIVTKVKGMKAVVREGAGFNVASVHINSAEDAHSCEVYPHYE